MSKVYLVDDLELIKLNNRIGDAIPIRGRQGLALRVYVPTTDEWPDIPSRLPRDRSILLSLRKEDALQLAIALYRVATE